MPDADRRRVITSNCVGRNAHDPLNPARTFRAETEAWLGARARGKLCDVNRTDRLVAIVMHLQGRRPGRAGRKGAVRGAGAGVAARRRPAGPGWEGWAAGARGRCEVSGG